MASLRLLIEDGKFVDPSGRQVILRGINVAGDAKYPSEPFDQPSQVVDGFFDGDNVSFHKRPFTKDEAHVHFARLRRFGYNTIRYVFTWEAIEAKGPGVYDEEWISHTIEVLRVAKSYGFFVFMDPHQDVWSRFSGGSGAPLWTLYLAGLNPRTFAATEAAIVHNTYPEPENFPKMIWSTNYARLAVATIFTLFFAGRDYAPKCIVDGVNVQDYLQNHFFGAIEHLAIRIKQAGDVLNDVVFGWESMNEPARGLIGLEDMSVIPKHQALKKGTCPTIWQAILTGSGRACEVDTWDMGGLGPYKVGSTLIDPHGEVAWLPADHDDSKYGWKRDPGWKLGECIWAQHGVWDPSSDTLLRKDYFAKDPKTGATADYPYFTNNWFMDFYRAYRDMVRSHHPEALMLCQPPVLELPPSIKGTEDDDPNMIYAPHYYDGITLMTKKWNRTWNVDVLGILRGRYLTPAFGIKIGETAIRNCFRDQLAAMRKEGLDYMGNHPCVLTEFGIPYDMDDKYAYKTGDYSSQSAAMDANHFAVEGSGMEGYALWVYVTNNGHQWGDQWNGEDLSIYSPDDEPLPVSAVPRSKGESRSSSDAPPPRPSEDVAVTPTNIKRTLTNDAPSTSSSSNTANNNGDSSGMMHTSDPQLKSDTPGHRAAEAYVRPAPVAVAGDILHYTFDLKTCTFTLKLRTAKDASPDAPTELFLPEYHFPRDASVVEVSGGKWEIGEGEEGDGIQRLRWWHGKDEQSIKITGQVRRYNAAAGGEDGGEVGYYDQLNNSLANGCAVM
ncbi:hypothetical protein VPNG_02107 [Cytospora leucostoma]|uniref:Glycoside hydrolase family 5 C-terminal domain-containing protein n=1 Tax=Cytospora leucostoma TaxID=1230097 RepID=A0A423XH96_9PEZI|nr:hypothetical protein VPNG_02107 [Cytospora leucostoma]